MIYASEKVRNTKKKRTSKKYTKTIYVTKEDCKTLLDHSPTAYLDPGSIKCISATFDNGYKVVIDISPTLELEDDFAVILRGKNNEFINKKYYEDFQETWVIHDPYTEDEYNLTTIRV